MKLFMCFGAAAAAVVDDEASAEAPARHRDQRGRSLSFRAKSFLSGKKGSRKKPSPWAESKRRGVDADDVYGGVFGTSASSSVASSTLLSSAASLDYSDSSSSSSSGRPSNASSSSAASVSGVFFPPPAKRRANKGSSSSSPAAGAAAVVLCLLMVVFCGRVGATLLTSTALYLFPRRWPARIHGDDGVDSLERDADEKTTAGRKVVMDQGSWVRNRKK